MPTKSARSFPQRQSAFIGASRIRLLPGAMTKRNFRHFVSRAMIFAVGCARGSLRAERRFTRPLRCQPTKFLPLRLPARRDWQLIAVDVFKREFSGWRDFSFLP